MAQYYGHGTDAAVTCTLASLADGSKRESDVVTPSNALDHLIGGKITTGTSPTDGDAIIVYVSASNDAGTTWSGNAAGAGDAAYNPSESSKLALLRIAAVIEVESTSDIAYEWGPVSVADLFGGILPEKYLMIVRNESGAALNATGGNHELRYLPITLEQS